MSGPRLLCLINSLEGGGAERVFTEIAGALAQAFPPGAVEIALLDAAPIRHPPPAMSVSVLGAHGGFAASLLGLSRQLRRRPPRVILSFLTRANCAAVLAGKACGARVLISERVHTSSHFAQQGSRAALQRALVRAIYPHADGVLAVSEGVAGELRQSYRVPAAKLRVAPNPVPLARLRAAARAPSSQALPARFFVAVGRLAPVKNYPLLLEAFAAAATGWDLVILGEGEGQAPLVRLAQDLGLSGRVHFLGFQANPQAVMARAQAYVSASRAEGFPNALAEAMALGLACLHTDCPAGPAELLGAGALAGQVRDLVQAPCGLLTPPGDVAAFARGLRALADPGLRARLGAAAAQQAAAFAPARAYAGYLEAVNALLPAGLRGAAPETWELPAPETAASC